MQTITLKCTQKILSDQPQLAYRIVSGHVRVFLQPCSEQGMQRQMFLDESGEGSIIPSMNQVYEQNQVLVRFRLLISAVEDTILETVENTEEIRRNFFASLMFFEENYEFKEEPETELLHIYQEKQQESISRIQKAQSHTSTSESQSADTVTSVFMGGWERRISSIEHSGNPIYDAAAYMSSVLRLPIASYEKVHKACGEEILLEDIARISGFICRKVSLEAGWRHRITEPVLCKHREDDTMCVCIPGRSGHMKILTPSTGKVSKAKPEELQALSPSAWVFHRPFEKENVSFIDITKLAAKGFSLSDVFFLILCMLLITGVGLQMANLNQIIFDTIIPQGDRDMLLGIGGVILACTVGSLCFSITKNLISYRIDSRIRYTLQAAVYERVFHLPESFFRNRDSAEQAYRIQLLNSSYMRIYDNAAQILLQGGFSLLYMWKMHQYSSVLSHIGTVFLVFNILITIGIGCMDRIMQRKKSRSIGRQRSFLYQALSGIEAIRVSGAEDEVMNVNMKQTAEAGLADKGSADNRRLSAMLGTLNNALSIMVLYYVYVTGGIGISIGAFMGFVTAFSTFSVAMCMVASNSMNIISMFPMLRDSSVFLKVTPESSCKGEIPEHLEGDIQLSHVSFAYGKDQKPVLQDISMHILPGEYVAVVGETGCGKSTLLRLLLGFEKPLAGKIYYDGITMDRFSMPELRRQIGVVLQDGSLLAGSIYKNIRIACPSATAEQIRQAVEDAGLQDVIDSMPMGMDTLVSEQGRTLSGGQKQRILIARAIVGEPRILFMDEATSSLDNHSQAKICESLEKYHATRLVIAHRLSTVEHCDRIIVLDKGRIVESGTYAELIEKKGKFFELAQNQMIKED